MAVLLVISVSMDVFDQCYTVCNSWTSSLKYGVFTVALIYLFFNLFISGTTQGNGPPDLDFLVVINFL